jgi:murein DD-endopeptidase MepM/ murein hydrolase activator NlpD
LSEIKTSAGAELQRGDEVGLMGATGNTTGPHVHYEIRLYGAPVNPIQYMQP